MPCSWPWRSQELTQGRRGSLSCWVSLGLWGLWPQVRSEAILPWGGLGRGGSPAVRAGLRPGPSNAAALLPPVFRAAGSAHLLCHHQASSEDSGGGTCPASLEERGDRGTETAGSSRHDLGGMGDWGHWGFRRPWDHSWKLSLIINPKVSS